MKILLIDNNDSFTNNLEHLLVKEINHAEVTVVSYSEILPCFVKADCEHNKKPLNLDEFDLIVISPGPGKPQDYPGKTMNRMDYLNAWQTAHDSGFDDVLLTDFEGRVLESSVASLLFKKGDVYIEPQTYYKLPGTSQEIAAKHLKIESKPILLESVHEYDHVFALNTLGGMIPVSAIGDVIFDTEHETARKISDIILELN